MATTFEDLREEVEELRAWQQVAIDSNKAIVELIEKRCPSLAIQGGMPVDDVRRALDSFESKSTDKISASEALYAFCGWLTTQDVKTVMSKSDNCDVIAHRIEEFCKVNDLQEPRDHWQMKYVMPEDIAEECYKGEESTQRRSIWWKDKDGSEFQVSRQPSTLEEALNLLSGDLSHDNVAKAKEILKSHL